MLEGLKRVFALPARKILLAPGLSLACTLAPAMFCRANAQELVPLSWPAGNAELRLAAAASGALFNPRQPGWGETQASGALRLMPARL